MGLFSLAEVIIDECEQRSHRFFFALTVGLDGDGRAFCGGQHHHAHDALCVDALTVASHPHLAGILRGELSEFGGSSCMQAEFVDDECVLILHL